MGKALFFYFDALRQKGLCNNRFIQQVGSVFYISEPSGYEMYIARDSLREVQKTTQKKFIENTKRLREGFEKDVTKFDILYSSDPSLKDAVELFHLAIEYLGATLPWFYENVENECKEIISESDKNNTDEVFQVLTSPIEQTSLLTRQIEYITLLEQKRSGKLLDENKQTYLNKYKFFESSSNDGFNILTKQALEKQLEVDSKNLESLVDELRQQQSNLTSVINRKKKVIEKLKLDKSARLLFDNLSELSRLRLEIRLMMQQPAESVINLWYEKYEKEYGDPLLLTTSELLDVEKIGAISKSLKEEVEKRKIQYVWILDKCEAIFLYDKDFSTFKKSNIVEAAKELRGSVVSKSTEKVIRGEVEVIRQGDPQLKSKIENFANGKILVANQTTPAFLPAIRKAKAVVADEGGILSHAAIISRELKVPCVVGTANAAKVLNNGDTIEINFDSGEVTKL